MEFLKREKTICGIPRNRGQKIANFHKTGNGRFTEIGTLEKKYLWILANSQKNHMYGKSAKYATNSQNINLFSCCYLVKEHFFFFFMLHKHAIILPKIGKFRNASGSNWKEEKKKKGKNALKLGNKSKNVKKYRKCRRFCKYIGNIGALRGLFFIFELNAKFS